MEEIRGVPPAARVAGRRWMLIDGLRNQAPENRGRFSQPPRLDPLTGKLYPPRFQNPGGTGADQGNAIAVNLSGNAYVAGTAHFHLVLRLPDPRRLSPLMAGLPVAYWHHYRRRHGPLFGILALQMDFARRDALIAAMNDLGELYQALRLTLMIGRPPRAAFSLRQVG